MRTIWLLFLGFAMSAAPARGEKTTTVWFGTRGDAIYRAPFNPETGELGDASVAADIKSPGFLVINSAGNRLYSLGAAENTDDNVAAFAIAEDHSLKLLGSANTGGGKPTHISLSRDEGTLFFAHYGGGSVASMAVEDSGKLLRPVSLIPHAGSSVNPSRQAEPHPHWIGVTPDNRFALVPDLGMDEVVIYKFDQATHTLERHGSGRVPPGSGPRHLKFHKDQPWVYVLNELRNTITGFRYEADRGRLDRFQTVVALPDSEVKVALNAGAEIRMHPSGKFLFAAIRGHDVIAVFSVDPHSGMLSFVEHEPIRGSWPRNFNLDPSGRWLLAAGAESNTVAVFEVNAHTGRLVFTRNVINVPGAICVEFLVR